MWSRLLPLALLLGVAGCAGDLVVGGPESGFSYSPPEESPHPGIAEGRPVVEIPQRGTWYRCPDIDPGGVTPMIPDQCLSPVPDVGVASVDGYSLVEASIDCGGGRMATDLGSAGFGFVGSPIIPQRGASPDRGAVLECLGVVSRS